MERSKPHFQITRSHIIIYLIITSKAISLKRTMLKFICNKQFFSAYIYNNQQINVILIYMNEI